MPDDQEEEEKTVLFKLPINDYPPYIGDRPSLVAVGDMPYTPIPSPYAPYAPQTSIDYQRLQQDRSIRYILREELDRILQETPEDQYREKQERQQLLDAIRVIVKEELTTFFSK